MRKLLIVALLALANGVQAGLPKTAVDQLARNMAAAQVVLLGELHDNPHVHELRAAALARRLEAGWRPVLVMEHFDRERQPDIERARREKPDDAAYLIAQAGGSQWPWSELKPLLQLALQYRLSIVAGNVSRADAGNIMRHGLGSVLDGEVLRGAGLQVAPWPALPPAVIAGEQAAIQEGHCGQAPPEMLPGLVQAQVARDLFMADRIRAHAGQGVVLLAGNGHVRRDIGVPRWLPDVKGVVAIGITEQPAPVGLFDVNQQVAAIERPDPCREFLRTKSPESGR